jgi:CRISPR-associated protein Cas1
MSGSPWQPDQVERTEGAPPAAAPEEISDGLIPARMLNEVVYCPRLFYLEHVAGEWEESADTLAGKRVHRRVDAKATAMADPAELPEGTKARSVTVSSEAEGIVAKVDLVEERGGRVSPVDYKRGAPPELGRYQGDVWPADRVQIGAQAMALRASGYACDEGVVYHAATRTRRAVPVDEALVADVRAAVAEARRVSALAAPPPPLVDSPKCPGCSLVGICLPDETNALLGRPEPLETVRPPRRLLPSADERHPCHVQAAGATVGKAGEQLEVRFRDGTKQAIGLATISHLSLFGRVHVTTAVLQEMCSLDAGVSFFTSGGWYIGTLMPHAGVNVQTRIAQFRTAADPVLSLPLARELISSKILNCRTLLRRNCRDRPQRVLDQLKRLAEDARAAASLDSLLGIEGAAGRFYFEGFPDMLAPVGANLGAFTFEKRNRRPPRDPINALLSFGYSLLLRECHAALLKVGFDPAVGFLHQPRPGRPGLALDLMEEFRPLIADSTVLAVVNTGAVQAVDFVRSAGSVALSESGRRSFLAAFERRMAQEITHPVFDYRITYRRVLEVQARLLARVILGELPEYPRFLTR